MLRRSALLYILALAGGCDGDNPVPPVPTWIDDVEPILRANCFSCHGAATNRPTGAKRWDVYDLSDPKLTPIGKFGGVPVGSPPGTTPLWVSTKDCAHAQQLFMWTDPGPLRMPPPPATPLSTRDRAVLSNWLGTGMTCANGLARGVRANNHLPTVAWLDSTHTQIVINDEDKDQVLGKVTCPPSTVPLFTDRTGAFPLTLTFPALKAGMACTVLLYDGNGQESSPPPLVK